MKNKILIMLLAISLFCFLPSVKANEKVKLTESSNGKLSTTVHFEEGFVGGIDVVFKLDGNVSVKGFQFTDKIAKSNYEKKYSYDAKNHTLTVRVATGGVGSGHNLLNSNKELSLGTIEIATTSKSNVEYSVGVSSMKIVDNTWNTKIVIDKLETPTKFVYHIKEEEPPKQDSDSNSNTNSNTSSNSNSHSNTNSNSNNNSNSSNVASNSNGSNSGSSNATSSNSTTNENSSSNIESNSNSQSNSSIQSGSNSNKESNSVVNSEEEKQEEKKTKKWPLMLIGGAAILAAVVGAAIAIKKKNV